MTRFLPAWLARFRRRPSPPARPRVVRCHRVEVAGPAVAAVRLIVVVKERR